MAGPGASEATYAESAATCSSLKLTRFFGTWPEVGYAAGIRPVPTWKSTAAAPTPIRVGPFEVPSAARPWQLEQLSRNSCLPASICELVAPLSAASAVPEMPDTAL